MRAADRKAPSSGPGRRAIRHTAIAATNAPAVSIAATIVCRNVMTASWLVRTAMKSVSSARPAAALNV